ncbi:MAG: thioredoxin family protein [Pseudomonadota bacterium]
MSSAVKRSLAAAALFGVAALIGGCDSSGKPVAAAAAPVTAPAPGSPPADREMPEFPAGATWINSAPLTREALRGKVVVVDFWTYSCINCLRATPYINAWYARYRDSGLVIIGVHSPEFGFEKDAANVRMAIQKFHIEYPVVLDNDFAIWKAYDNRFWPAHYFIDAEGRIRGHHYGEGKYAESEHTIRALLTEAGVANLPPPVDAAAGEGVTAAADVANIESPETYLGFARGENFTSPGSFEPDAVKDYQLPAQIALNEWALAGRWLVSREKAQLQAAPGRIKFRFKARDLHLVLGPGPKGEPVRFRVLLDGKPPGADHGMDIDASGAGVVREQRLYQLIRQQGGVQEHDFTIEFLDPHVEAFSFTFG